MAGQFDTQLRQLRLFPPEDSIDTLMRRTEDQWFDRTSARTDARHLANMMVAFANAEGGLIVIGMHNGAVEGIDSAGANAQNQWRQAARDFTEPPVRHTFDLFACTNAQGKADHVALVEVDSSERVHTNVKGETLLRVGDESRRLGVVEAQELRFDKGESTFDGQPVAGATYDDLDQALTERYLDTIRSRGRPEVALGARGLVVERQGELIPTNAGLLLLGTDPQRLLPSAYVRVLRYRGSSRETGVRANVTDDHRIGGPVSRQIERARRRVARMLPSTVHLQPEGRFGRGSVLPEFAWLEAIVNAVTHRSYSMGGDHIRVEIFDDRLEVESPGRLPGLVRVENLRSTRFARNPRLARALSDLEYVRELGEGVNRMFEEMQRAGLPDPIYHQGSASVRVTLLADAVAGRLLTYLPPGSERFAEHLSRLGRITTTEAVDLLGASRPTVLRYLHDLVGRGLLEHVGTSLRDPRGYWRLVRGNRDA